MRRSSPAGGVRCEERDGKIKVPRRRDAKGESLSLYLLTDLLSKRVELGVFQCRKASCCEPCSPPRDAARRWLPTSGNAGTQQHRFAVE